MPIAFEIGYGTKATAIKLWMKVKYKVHKIDYVRTDCNFSYDTILPTNPIFHGENAVKHIISQQETSYVEYWNSILRNYLARLNRKTTRFSKTEEMLRYSIWMLFY